LYAESPSFDAYYENRFSWGEVQIGLNFVNGYIKKANVYSDAMNTTFVNKLVDVLTGIRYDNRDIHKAIGSTILDDEEKQIFIDISSMFE
jgi:lipoate-protein ligase A